MTTNFTWGPSPAHRFSMFLLFIAPIWNFLNILLSSHFYFKLTRYFNSTRNSFVKSESESRSVMSDSLQPHGLYSPWNSPGQNTGVGNLSLLQGIFPTQGSNPGLMHCRQILYQLSHKGSNSYVGLVFILYYNSPHTRNPLRDLPPPQHKVPGYTKRSLQNRTSWAAHHKQSQTQVAFSMAELTSHPRSISTHSLDAYSTLSPEILNSNIR